MLIYYIFSDIFLITISEFNYDFTIKLEEGYYYFYAHPYYDNQQQIEDRFYISSENNQIVINFRCYQID